MGSFVSPPLFQGVIELPLFMSERQKDVTARNQEDLFSQATGKKIGQNRRVYAQFEKGGVPDWALPLAEKTFAMNGRPPEIEPRRFLSTYDSTIDQKQRGWTDDERELIEAKLRTTQGVVEISPPKVEAPWPKYDELVVHGRRTIAHVIEKISEGMETTGETPESVIAYERQSLNRPEVIEAVEALTRIEEPAEELIEA